MSVDCVPRAPRKRFPMARDATDTLIDRLTQQTGLSRDELLKRLSQVLPQTVDQLTPDGDVTQAVRARLAANPQRLVVVMGRRLPPPPPHAPPWRRPGRPAVSAAC